MKAWLQLFRVPNLFTVPGDPLAAFLIATGGLLDARVWPAVAASLCLYSAGLAMNDLADYKEDLQDRPHRPLPSGRVGVGAAWAVVILLSMAALGLLSLAGPYAVAVGIGLLVHIALYNFLTKRIPVLGAVNMGLCRALSAALGAVAGLGPSIVSAPSVVALFPSQPPLAFWLASNTAAVGLQSFQAALICGGLVGLYIAAVTNLARHETKPTYPRLARMLPIGAVLIGYIVLKQFTGPVFQDQSPMLWVVGLILCAMNASELMKEPPPPLPPRIGGFIRILPVLQAALCLAPTVPTMFHKTAASFLCALALLACVPLHSWLGKKFYAS
jgi:4-hydroxybenzoate polyprenyltransferase